MWDLVIDFFSGAGNFVTDVASGAAGAVSTFGDWVGGLFEGGSTAASVASAAADGGKSVAEGVSGLAVDSVDTKSLAEQVNSGEGIFADAAQDVGKAAGGAAPEKGLFGQMVQWVKELDPDEKKMFFKALEVGGGVAGGMGIAALKGKSQEDSIRLQAELAGQKAYDEQSGVTRAKQELNKVPAGVPFKPKKGGLLTNQMGQPVYNPNNPLVPRPGLINGVSYGR